MQGLLGAHHVRRAHVLALGPLARLESDDPSGKVAALTVATLHGPLHASVGLISGLFGAVQTHDRSNGAAFDFIEGIDECFHDFDLIDVALFALISGSH